jgi:hypothetical protein
MALIATRGSNGTYTPAPEGTWDAVLCDVKDLGLCDTQYGKKHQIRLVWQISEKMEDGRPFTIGRRYGLSLNEKSSLFKDVKSWFGKIPPAELDLEKLIGQNCQLVIQHSEKDGTTYANVIAVLKAGKAKLKVSEDYTRVKDRAPKEPAAVAHYSPPDSNVPF